MSRRWNRWLLVGIALVVLGLGALAVWPRASRLLFVSALPDDQRQALIQEGISVDPPSLAEIPDILLASTGPEAIESMVQDRGATGTTIRLLSTHVTATSLYQSWDGLAYVASLHKSQDSSNEVLVVSARDGSLILDLTFATNTVAP